MTRTASAFLSQSFLYAYSRRLSDTPGCLFPRRADHMGHLNACNGCRDSGELEAPTLALCPSLPSVMIEREETRPRHRLQTSPSTTRCRFMTTASGERQRERGGAGGRGGAHGREEGWWRLKSERQSQWNTHPLQKQFCWDRSQFISLAFASRSVLTFLTQPLPPSVRDASQTTQGGLVLAGLIKIPDTFPIYAVKLLLIRPLARKVSRGSVEWSGEEWGGS